MHQEDTLTILQDLLASLRAAHWIHWSGHWQTNGNPYYGDHLLLERLYTGIVEEIDTLAEKMVAQFGPSAVDPAKQAERTTQIINSLCSIPQNPIVRSLHTEEMLQELFSETFTLLEQMGTLSLGMNDFIAATANAHETFMYLLRQRTR